MRLFVAVVPPAAALASFVAALPAWRALAPDLAWVDPARWHVTLVFLGDHADPEPFAAALESIAGAGTIATEIGGGGAFPSAARARVVWFGAGNERLAELAARYQGQIGLMPERDRFAGHITVARARRARLSAHLSRPLLSAIDAVAPVSFVAKEVVLMRSHLGANPRYERLAAAQLDRSAGNPPP